MFYSILKNNNNQSFHVVKIISVMTPSWIQVFVVDKADDGQEKDKRFTETPVQVFRSLALRLGT